MQIEGAVVREQSQTFAIAVIKSSVAAGGDRALREAVASFTPIFPGMPIILMWQDMHGIPTYWGTPEIVNFLRNIEISRIPWRRYSIAA
jgi:hypothetical protein